MIHFFLFSHFFFLSANFKKNDSVNKNRNTCYLKVSHIAVDSVQTCSSEMFVARGFFVGSCGDMLIDDTDSFFFSFFSDLVKYVVTTKSHFKEKIVFPDILKKGFISLGLCSKASCPTLKWFPRFSI